MTRISLAIRIAAASAAEVGYLACKFGLSVGELIAKGGNDCETLEREAKARGSR